MVAVSNNGALPPSTPMDVRLGLTSADDVAHTFGDFSFLLVSMATIIQTWGSNVSI